MRKPRVENAPEARLPANHAGALSHLDPKQVIPRFLADERIGDIAAALGVHHSALNYWLLRVCESEWKEALVARALTRLQVADEDMDAASDALSLARARERSKSAQWQLERLCRRLYGQDAPAQVNAVQINISVRRDAVSAQPTEGDAQHTD